MHIAQIIEATNAGVARHVFDLTEVLAGLGHSVELVYSSRRLDRPNRQRLEALGKSPLIRTFECDLRRSPHPTDATAARRIIRSLRSLPRLDLVHGHSTKGGAIARLVGRRLKRPVIYTPNAVRSMDPDLPRFAKNMIVRIERFLSRWTAHTIAVSPEEQEHLVRDIRVPEEKTTVVPNGIVPYERPSREEARQFLGIPLESECIGFVGRLGWQKGPDLLVEALPEVLSRNPTALVAIVGDGDMRSELEVRCRALGIDSQVHFLGFRDGPMAMPAFDCFVLPSRYEGLPYVLLEAMHCGLPIVASDQTGCRLLVESGKNGFVYPFDDRSMLAKSLVQLLANRNYRETMGAESMERALKFTAEQMTLATVDVYRKVLEQFPHRVGRRS